ncbi:MAG: hypothetical protein E7376_02210 [Clostridiales bacterium]|nr:hypothetical protein [Clostridiales bacterium]
MPYDSLDGWRKEVGITTSKGEKVRYEGGCEYDATAAAIMEYMRQEELAKKAKEQNKEQDLGR